MAVRFHNRCRPSKFSELHKHQWANGHAGKKEARIEPQIRLRHDISRYNRRARGGSRLDHDYYSVRKAFTVSWLTFIRFTIPLLLMSCGKYHCGLTGTGSHRTMGPLLRLGQDNFAYHCGPGRDARLDHDHSQKGLHCVGADVHAIRNGLAG